MAAAGKEDGAPAEGGGAIVTGTFDVNALENRVAGGTRPVDVADLERRQAAEALVSETGPVQARGAPRGVVLDVAELERRATASSAAYGGSGGGNGVGRIFGAAALEGQQQQTKTSGVFDLGEIEARQAAVSSSGPTAGVFDLAEVERRQSSASGGVSVCSSGVAVQGAFDVSALEALAGGARGGAAVLNAFDVSSLKALAIGGSGGSSVPGAFDVSAFEAMAAAGVGGGGGGGGAVSGAFDLSALEARAGVGGGGGGVVAGAFDVSALESRARTVDVAALESQWSGAVV